MVTHIYNHQHRSNWFSFVHLQMYFILKLSTLGFCPSITPYAIWTFHCFGISVLFVIVLNDGWCIFAQFRRFVSPRRASKEKGRINFELVSSFSFWSTDFIIFIHSVLGESIVLLFSFSVSSTSSDSSFLFVSFLFSFVIKLISIDFVFPCRHLENLVTYFPEGTWFYFALYPKKKRIN